MDSRKAFAKLFRASKDPAGTHPACPDVLHVQAVQTHASSAATPFPPGWDYIPSSVVQTSAAETDRLQQDVMSESLVQEIAV